MSEVARKDFLIRGMKERSEDDDFHGHHLRQSPFGQVSGSSSLLFTDAYRSTILEQNRRNRQLISPFSPTCSSIALKRARVRIRWQAAGDPARSILIPPLVGDSYLTYLPMWIRRLDLGIFVQIVCNRLQHTYITEMSS